MYLSNDEYSELLENVRRSIETLRQTNSSQVDVRSVYRTHAFSWLRRNPTKWKWWTANWDQKLTLTIAGLFSTHGKSVMPELQKYAQTSIEIANRDADHFGLTEYELQLDVRNLSCNSGAVLSEYFNILAHSTENRLVGSIAALCSDSIEAMVELSNMRKKVIISPTVATARFLEQQHYPFFFRTSPAMTPANYILLQLFLQWGWRRIVMFRKLDHVFNPRLFQAHQIEIIADIQVDENQLTYKSARNTLENLKRSNSRIFVVEHDTRGTYLILCAAHHLGMHLSAGYVWFLNPWLSSNWWTHPSLTRFAECTSEDLANISTWTLTVGHQNVVPEMLHSLFRLFSSSYGHNTSDRAQPNVRSTNLTSVNSTLTRSRRQASSGGTENQTDPLPADIKLDKKTHRMLKPMAYDPSILYQTYTTDAVLTLASALVNLLKENPSALSALDHPSVAESFRSWVARTEFTFTKPYSKKTQPASENFFLNFGFQSTSDLYGRHFSSTGLHFNKFNERVAEVWVLKQRRLNVTLPAGFWFPNPDYKAEPVHMADGPHSGTATSQIADILADFNRFKRQMQFTHIDNVQWSAFGGLPHDGSITAEDCAFLFLSDTLRMGCTAATVFVAVSITLACLFPVLLASLYYRRKLREAERRTRKPFEELCAELADLDMPVETIVLNRQIGQGAFGLVFGGEAKSNGRWVAVAVKAINEKANYDGKFDFLSEAKLMRSLNHKNVVRLIGVSLNQKDNLYLVMELMLKGDLKTYLLFRRILAQRSADHEDVRPRTLTRMGMDIAEGVSYLHSKNLIHRDIACRNCLVAQDNVVKIGDFGLTREAGGSKTENYYRFSRNCALPVRWMSPEAVQYGIFSVQSDVWSYGITLYEITTFGVFPYGEMGDVEVVERVKRMEFCISDFLPPSARNTIIWQLIRQCCQHHSKDRLSMAEVLQVLRDHPECIRPMLTDDPPKPVTAAEPLPFRSFVGTRFLPDTATRDDGFSASVVAGVGGGRGFRNVRSVSVTPVPVPDSLSLKFSEDFEVDENNELEERRRQLSCPAQPVFMCAKHENDAGFTSSANLSSCVRSESSSGAVDPPRVAPDSLTDVIKPQPPLFSSNPAECPESLLQGSLCDTDSVNTSLLVRNTAGPCNHLPSRRRHSSDGASRCWLPNNGQLAFTPVSSQYLDKCHTKSHSDELSPAEQSVELKDMLFAASKPQLDESSLTTSLTQHGADPAYSRLTTDRLAHGEIIPPVPERGVPDPYANPHRNPSCSCTNLNGS
ncbi:Guanylate cyclase [Paragonimus heterotremus]|uniref:Guanylate cyclase n=1 Tax=Paragonimus heterotremus TaxID=100268 RepID=A0A8J4TFI1_9TREM|nr:Guanylate cyclase [Paragonimus heterotremus]